MPGQRCVVSKKLKLHFVIAFLGMLFSHASFAGNINILDKGAIPDGKTLVTEILQTAIDKVSEQGGGTVIIPPGHFLTGSIILKSGVNLEVQKGAVLLGSTKLEDYLSIQPEFVALRTIQPTKQLIFSEAQNDVSISGMGIIDGQGAAFSSTLPGDDAGITRPHLIQMINCKNVKIEGVNLRNSGAWMQHYLACENLQILGITVYNHCNKNNDGIDVDGCSNVVISDCIIDSDDDGICLKSTSPAICKDVTVSNCVVKSHCNALKLGTESTGGFKNVTFSNCVVSPSVDPDPVYGTLRGQSAISVEMVDGGVLDGVNISNITITETDCPIFVRLGNRARKHAPDAPVPGMGTLRNVHISNIIATTSSKLTSSITGVSSAFAENISLDNIRITNLSDGTAEEASMAVKENDKGYPTPNMFGDILPASGFFVRHVRNITFNNIQLFNKGDNVRPAFIFHNVSDALIINPVVRSDYEKPEIIVKDQHCENVRVTQ
ncbi:glycoside hydrolase family 28 protein [Sunxiuqinia rutila]|uniref:glycoside hydrolase family 28 protein n=1 Tax=Sunxiuqinia rutila TaxID=1397841 RepID=UPI003D359F55